MVLGHSHDDIRCSADGSLTRRPKHPLTITDHTHAITHSRFHSSTTLTQSLLQVCCPWAVTMTPTQEPHPSPFCWGMRHTSTCSEFRDKGVGLMWEATCAVYCETCHEI